MSQLTTRNAGSDVDRHSVGSPKMPLYTYDIPRKDRLALIDLLEKETETNPSLWESIANLMKVGDDYVKEIGRDKKLSKIENLFSVMDSQEKTVKKLFGALSQLQLVGAMKAIKHLVPSKYHKLMAKEPPGDFLQPDLSNLLDKNLTLTETDMLPVVLKDLNSQIGSTTGRVEAFATEVPGMPELKYEELTEATDNWNPSLILGRGGFGVVFKGEWKHTPVAIKRIEPREHKSSDDYKTELKQSMNELKFLNTCRHPNILPLFGFCLTGEKPCLVYQLMPCGTLEQQLFSKNSLDWKKKLDIARGTACGLQFMHTFQEKPLIHGDIKPANILLDVCGMPKIGDFGLARESPSKDPVEISKVYGTRPYLPREFINTRCLSTKIDTYSFGIVLYELATKKRVWDRNRTPQHIIELMNLYHQQKIHFSEVIDRTYLSTEEDFRIGYAVFPVLTLMGQRCTQSSDKRPEMVEVFKLLEGKE